MKGDIIGRCAVCGEPLTFATVWIGEGEILCRVHAAERRRKDFEKAGIQYVVCVDCLDLIPRSEAYFADDGPLCEVHALTRRMVAIASRLERICETRENGIGHA